MLFTLSLARQQRPECLGNELEILTEMPMPFDLP